MAASPSLRICFNSECSELKSERTRKGWRLRTGDFAQLCDRCGSVYEEGRFCEKFHSKASGWRSCESCGKRVHCGCIVSVHAYMLLDAGGVECIACAKKNTNLVANPVWPPSVSFHSSLPVRSKDISLKNWNYLAGSGPVPWHQAPTMFNASVSQPDLFKRMINDVDSPTGLDRHNLSDKLSALSFEKNKIENYPNRFMNGMLKLGSQDIFENGNTGMVNLEHARSNLSNCQRPQKDEAANSHSAIPSVSSTEEKNGHMGALGTSIRPSPQPLPVKPYHDNQQNGPESSGDTQIPSGKPRCDPPGRSLGFPRYWPRFTDQDLQQTSGDSNSVITPLFEKMLSASDAGRIGRLVLPKKCAEAYFPPISQPEGLPLQVQDSKGNEWKFQFRFWPNNNSRMYVLEGVTPCIQSMQLQAGDVVTFSRVEPGGKLLMGFRKSSIVSASDQDHEVKCSNGVSTDGAELADPTSCSKVDKSGYSAKDAIDMKPSISRKRKSSVLGLKNKRLKVDNEELIELKVTWEEAQVLLRPPPNHISSIVVIEGFEFEEYEDAPVIGKPTIFATDNEGKKVQWAQCEECFKWRKLPANAFLPSRWTCFGNSWDPDRSFCLAAQELTAKQLDDLLACRDSDNSKKMKAAKMRTEDIDSLEGLDTLANLAIFGESEGADEVPSSQVTTKHPRHRPGCSCIVCIQPPSKGPKHKPTCTCNVCLMVKRRFCTLASRREKKQPQKEQEVSQEKPETPVPDKLDGETISSNNAGSNSPDQNKAISEGSDGDPNKIKSSNSPFKGQIDLNIQPEREEELSPHRGRVIDLESYHWSPPLIPVSGETSTLASNQSQVRVKEEEMNGSSTISIVSSYQDTKTSNIARFASTISGPALAAGSCRERFIDVESLNCDPIDVETYWPRSFQPLLPGSSETYAQASNQRQVRIKEEENDGSTIPIVSSHRDAENGHTARFASTISGSTTAARSHWARSTDVESWNWHPIDVESYKWSSPFVPGLPSSSETYIPGSNQRQIRITEEGNKGSNQRQIRITEEGNKGSNQRQIRITGEGNNGNTIATVSSSHQDADNGHMTQFTSTVSGSTSAAG